VPRGRLRARPRHVHPGPLGAGRSVAFHEMKVEHPSIAGTGSRAGSAASRCPFMLGQRGGDAWGHMPSGPLPRSLAKPFVKCEADPHSVLFRPVPPSLPARQARRSPKWRCQTWRWSAGRRPPWRPTVAPRT
jgi:hypothetical protein